MSGGGGLRILLINHYAGSVRHGMEYRPFYLAREWLRLGHAVQVVAASFSHVRNVQPAVRAGSAREVVDGVEYLWLRTPGYGGNGVRRAINIAAFCLQLARCARRMAREFRPDVVVASSTYPMDIWPASMIARAAGAKLIHEVHDLWPLSPIELAGMSPRHPFIRLCQLAEDAACRDADWVISMLPEVAGHFRERGLDLRKLHIVPNGVAPEDWTRPLEPLPGEIAGLIAQQRTAGRLIVTYSGSHGGPNALDVLLDAARAMANDPIDFVLVGNGLEKLRLARRVAAESLHNVRMFDSIAKAQIPTLLAQTDIAYIGWKRQPLYRFGIAPNKLMDYMMAGVPVLHSVEAGNDPVEQADCGVTVVPESAPAVVAGLRRLAALPADERAAMGARGRAFVLGAPHLSGAGAPFPGGDRVSESRETEAVVQRYARRAVADPRYSLLRPDVWQTVQERQRAMLRMFVRAGFADLAALRLLEVGCGSGGNLLELLRLGFAPERLTGVELIAERAAAARRVLPAALLVRVGDALALELPEASQDIAYVSTVFSSLLDAAFQRRLADAMWRWVKPGGAVLWYDFTYDNPNNSDVRGVPLARVRELFPSGIIDARRVTLAPPIARRVAPLHPALYTVFNAIPWLRTHLLAWIAKP